jgi:hypothetical protein
VPLIKVIVAIATNVADAMDAAYRRLEDTSRPAIERHIGHGVALTSSALRLPLRRR